MKYAVSDIHGCFNEFMKILELIKFSDGDELYVIGDAIDRGPDPIKTLLHIMNHKNMHMILGNHEAMMLEALEEGHFSLWYANGGKITNNQFEELDPNSQDDVLAYLKSLPLGLEVGVPKRDYILIHGGPTTNFVKEWDAGNISEGVLWERFESCSSDEIVYPGKIIIVGHTPTFLYGADDRIIVIGDKRLIDCGCVFGHSLGCICLDTEECFCVKKSD